MVLRDDLAREQQLARLQVGLGFGLSDLDLLDRALTHSSFANEAPSEGLEDNQRLEFLGDAIIDFLVADWLFQRYPDAPEGELTSLRADVVRTSGLAAFAREISLGQYLLMGRGEHASGGARRAGNLCAAFEALAGAIYLDQGIETARRWLEAFLERHAERIDAVRAAKDAKSALQEQTQARLHITPAYRLVGQSGPDHAKVFTAQVWVGDELWGQGTGSSKQAAEAAAAEAALQHTAADS